MNKKISFIIIAAFSFLSKFTYADYSEDYNTCYKLSLSQMYDDRDHLIKTIDPNAFLSAALHKVVGKLVGDPEAVRKQKELIQLAIGNEAKLESAHYSIDLDTLDRHKELFLDHMSPTSFCKIVLSAFVSYFDFYSSRSQELEKQRELFKLAIEKGVKLSELIEKNKYLLISLETLELNQDLFLEHLGSNGFLRLVLRCDIVRRLDVKDEYNYDEALVNKQFELMQLAIAKGAKIDQVVPLEAYAYTVYRNKELFLRELGADRFLYRISTLRLHYKSDLERKYQLELVQMAINAGADVKNSKINLGSLFDNIELLKLMIDNGVVCNGDGFEEVIEGGLEHIATNPQWILDQKYKNLNATESFEPKMPYVIHHIWLTHPSSPKEIRKEDIVRAIETKEIFSKSKVEWQHIVWTNNLDLIPGSVIKLEEAGICVKSIYEYKDDFKLFKLIETLIDNKEWGKASDTLRYSIVEHLGGVYADINFEFYRDPTLEVHKYNFFTMTYANMYISNFFFGSSPKHPILNRILELVERNLVAPPNYIASIEDQSSTLVTGLSTASPTYLAYYLKANQGGNIDVVYPSLSEKDINSDLDPDYSNDNNSETPYKLLKGLCPMIDFYDYVDSRELCPLKGQIIGQDGTNGRTWVSSE